jgi:hypothetical protein
MESLIWVGIAICLTQSGIFSGLNLALLGLSRMRLQAEAAGGSLEAARILEVRQDAHLLLTTLLWGNVAVNCLLTLLCESILAGVGAFLFATVGITLCGEIVPQAYFSRYALRIGAVLTPVVRMYQWLLYPLAKPSAKLLDWILGSEEIPYFRERDLREVIKLHALAPETDLDRVEAIGALNFLALDDLPVSQEGERIDPASVIALPSAHGLPVVPAYERSPSDAFLRRIHASGKKWVILTDPEGTPCWVLNADGFLRDALFGGVPADFLTHCHRPIVVHAPERPLGDLVSRLRVQPDTDEDDVIDRDLILLWGEEKRVVTGADLLGRLLRGIAIRDARGAERRVP